jgi:hypothetical protein
MCCQECRPLLGREAGGRSPGFFYNTLGVPDGLMGLRDHALLLLVRGGGMSCPVKAIRAWLQATAIAEGALFRAVAKGGRLGEQRWAAGTGRGTVVRPLSPLPSRIQLRNLRLIDQDDGTISHVTNADLALRLLVL